MKEIDRRSFLGLSTAGVASLLLAACGAQAQQEPAASEASTTDNETTDNESADTVEAEATNSAAKNGSAAVVWFSWSGNTAGVAERIVSATGAQAFEVVPEVAYPEVYEDCTDVALQEQRDGTMPAYQGDVDGWDGVSVVYLGYPIWWMDLPQIIKSFIADHDWAGKTVVPFSTYFSSGWSDTPEKIADTCAGATVAEGLSLAQGDLPDAYTQIDGWLEGLAL
ncbi:MAG: twin-arginine translocation signal domain-containing protein [Atopobiaceae bacterium]|nr:twin-arginine translocation signal domain-containing protein [Atopobiaceae bacterium]MBR1828528.1 twin-arginine translocation signal domain-containing protein [Atopobiaceae bacterium]